MDLRVDVVGASCQNDTSSSCFFQVFQSSSPFFSTSFRTAASSSHAAWAASFTSWAGITRDLVYQAVGEDRLGSEGKERIAEINGRISEFVHIVLDVLRIGGDNGAVIMIYRIRNSFLS